MKLTTDSSDITSRSPLGIDLNEIPSTSTSSPPENSLDVVLSFHENPDPAPGMAAGLRAEGSMCGACGKPEVRGQVVVCDGCERGFHLGCAGRQAINSAEWLCGECLSGGVKSKRWPLGVKRILDINASPPSDAEDELLSNLRKHTQSQGDNSFGAPPLTYSNLFYTGYGLLSDVMRPMQTADTSAEGAGMSFPQGSLRSRNNTTIRLLSRNPSEIFLQGLREFISERHGVLEEGWSVEFKHSISNYDLYAVYCSPDGKTFHSMSEVACHLGLMPNRNSIDTDSTSYVSPSPQETLHLPRKSKSKRCSLTNVFSEHKTTLVSGYCKELFSNGQSIEINNANLGEVRESEMQGDGISDFQPSNEGLPVQFEDFFVLSLGKIDVRPTYHNASLIWPVGYRSCWHDKITGSIFLCEVSDGGDSGPVFKVRRVSCSLLPVPQGLTVLCRTNFGQYSSHNNQDCHHMIFHNIDCESDDNIELILADPAPPSYDDVLTCLQGSSNRTSEIMQTSSFDSRSENFLFSDKVLGEEIGEISVEERSSTSAWTVISQKLVDAYSEIHRQRGTLKVSCNHADNEMGSPGLYTKNENSNASSASLAKFCSCPNFVGIPLECQGELEAFSSTLSEWLDQDRFGLDTEFVQEMIEQLPGAKACLKYEFLINRGHYSVSPTVGNGFLMAKRKSRSESDALFQRSKKARLAKEILGDYQYPAGRPLCSRLPPVLVGDFYQVLELLWRFHEILGLKEPLSLEELEEELINPWSNLSHLLKNLENKVHGSEAIDFYEADSMSGLNSFLPDKSGMTVCEGNSHACVNDEGCRMGVKDGGQATVASVTHISRSGVASTNAHCSLLGMLISELQCKIAPLVDPNFDSGETKSKRGRRKDADSSAPTRRNNLNMLPINELTWPELARRYILAVLTMDGNLESAEITGREMGRVFRCIQGDGGVLCGALTGVAGMEADALFLAEATKKVFGSLSRKKDFLSIEDETADTSCDHENNNMKDGNIPEWAQVLEPVRKLPTNVGARIRKCVYDALEKCPPEWAKTRLEHSISKEVYKGNASGPTKKAVLSVLADVLTGVQQKAVKTNKKKISIPISDIIMKQCRIVLREAAAADDAKVFCTLLGRNLRNSCDTDDEGLLGSPAMVSRPLDFRTIDLRLAAGAYGGSHESFLEDVRELWSHVRMAFREQGDLVELAETLSQNFESLFEKEVVTLVKKFEGYAKLDHISAEIKKELDDFLASIHEVPKAPWDEGVCKVCGVDKDDNSVLLCDTCDAEYHTYCLNPPLARIPEGNWYCPSCVVSKHVVQEASGISQVIGIVHCKKYQGEITHVYLEKLSHLSVTMKEKEYWEFSVDERIYLLKFLCDELLNSGLIRQNLEQCAETTNELQQKLRAFSMEWKTMKSKEDFLASRAADMDGSAVGEVGLKEALASAIPNQPKQAGQQPDVSDGPSHCSSFGHDVPALNGGQDGTRINGFDKYPSVSSSGKNHSCNSQTVNHTDTKEQVNDPLAVVDGSKLPSRENEKSSGPNNLSQIIGDMDEIQFQGNLQGYAGRGTSLLPPPDVGFGTALEENSRVSQHVPPVAINESEGFNLELSAVKNDLLHLQNSISRIQSQLLKLSVRREFLGSDSRGRLYWASTGRGSDQRVIVDGSLTLQQRNSDQFATRLNLEEQKTFFPFQCTSNNVLAMCSPCVSYETEEEIEQLISWLKDDVQKERELKESISQCLKQRFQETRQARDLVQEEHQALSVITNNNNTAFANYLVTKAAMFLEKKYGPLVELHTSDKLVKRARVTGEGKMYRCDCLEPILPSRHHCLSCHRTFSDDIEFNEHNGGRCNLITPANAKSEYISGFVKVKGNMKSQTTQKVPISEMDVVETSRSGSSGLGSRLIKSQNEGICPYDFSEISSKFVTEDSNKELVHKIGLIGSNGVPSFITSLSSDLNHSMSMLICHGENNGVVGDELSIDGRMVVSKGKKSESSAALDNIYDNSSWKSVANEISKVSKTEKPPPGHVEHRKKKSSSNKHFPEIGAGFCCVVPRSSLRPLAGKVLHILRRLKINLLDMEAALPEEALKPSKVHLDRRLAWRVYVKSAGSIYEMIQATIILEEMIKTDYLRNEWWYWSSFSAAAKTSTIASLALRIYSLDAVIVYEKATPNLDSTNSLKPVGMLDKKPLPGLDLTDKSKVSRKSNKKRKEPE